MAWEQRKNTSQRYYYRSLRAPDGRVVKTYHGTGHRGAMAADADRLRRDEQSFQLQRHRALRHYALLALMCVYGIELLADNIAECRANVLEILAEYLNLDESDELYRAATYVLSQNLIHGDALTMRTRDAQPICFAEWGYLGKGKFQRRDFHLATLIQSSAFSADDTNLAATSPTTC